MNDEKDRSPAATVLRGAVAALVKQWPHSIYTEFHLDNWAAADFAKHTETTLKTVRWLVHVEKEMHRILSLLPPPDGGEA